MVRWLSTPSWGKLFVSWPKRGLILTSEAAIGSTAPVLWIDPDAKVAQLRECAATAAEVGIRCEQRVIENVIEIRSEGRNHALSDWEGLVDTQIHAPCSGPRQHISLSHGRVVKQIRSDRRKTE